MGFTEDMKRWAEKAQMKLDEAVRGVTLELSTSIILNTPVDSGRARGNWQPSLNAPATGDLELTDKSGQSAIGKVQDLISQVPGKKFYLVNNLPYIRTLEYGGFPYSPNGKTTSSGFSSQAPQGMIRINVDRVKANIKELINESSEY